jgi:hypothetical protein
MYFGREFVVDGGLMSYASNLHNHRHGKAERPRRFEIDDQLELGRLHYGQIRWLGALENPTHVNAGFEAARKLGQQVHVVNATTENDFDRAFATLVQLQARALLVTVDPVFNSGRLLRARRHRPRHRRAAERR